MGLVPGTVFCSTPITVSKYVSCVHTCDIQEVRPPRGRLKFPGGPVRNIPHERWGEVRWGELAGGRGGGS